MPQGWTIAIDAEFKKVLAQVYEHDLFYVFHRYHTFIGFVKSEIFLVSSM